MDRDDSERPRRRLIGEDDKARVLRSLRAGASREEAAAAAGFAMGSFYGLRLRDEVFRLAWDWAMELAAVEERGFRLSPVVEEAGDETGEVRIVPCNGRLLQRRRLRIVKFNEKRQQIFLDHFAGTADAKAAAAAAGVSYHAVRAHYRRNPEFAALWDETLRFAYAMLEAEAVRQRLEAQRRLSDNLQPTGEMAQEFERVMKLLARYDRRGGRVGTVERVPMAHQAWTWDDAIAALDKRLRALGLRSDDPEEDSGPGEDG
ncbi:MAG TPA: hypothetical protein VFP12_03210 [Allosphingosinicella sp.]|nr:hypothetical protein [Allosphingosinicella sp.]